MQLVARLSLLGALAGALSAGAAAQERPLQQEPIEIDFDTVEITVELVRPNVTMVMETTRPEHPSLIELRGDFAREMAMSVDEVRW